VPVGRQKGSVKGAIDCRAFVQGSQVTPEPDRVRTPLSDCPRASAHNRCWQKHCRDARTKASVYAKPRGNFSFGQDNCIE
jgi:hypothetical protein